MGLEPPTFCMATKGRELHPALVDLLALGRGAGVCRALGGLPQIVYLTVAVFHHREAPRFWGASIRHKK